MSIKSVGSCRQIAIALKNLDQQQVYEDETSNQDKSKKQVPFFKPTLKRYVILLLFCLNSGNKSFQWAQIPVITTKATYYFGVDVFVINTLSTLYLITFIFLSWPACCIITRLGLRKAILLASAGTMCGAILKCFCCGEDGGNITILILGQILVSMSEQLVFSLPSKLASVWFPDDEVSSAMGTCVLGNMMGIATAFVVTPFFFSGSTTLATISTGFFHMFLMTAVYSIATFIFCCLFFDEAPKHPPGAARFRQIELDNSATKRSKSIMEDMWDLFKLLGKLLCDGPLLLLSICYGTIVGLGYAVTSLLDQTMVPIWPDDDKVVGFTGFLIVIFGAMFSPFWGRVLDWFHRYKLTNFIMIFMCFVTTAGLTYSIEVRSHWLLYIFAVLYGIFYTGEIGVGLELAVEMTYPTPELVVASLMNVTPQLIGTIIIYVGSYLVDTFGPLVLHGFYLVLTLVSMILLLCTKETLKRQTAVELVTKNQKESS